MRQRIFSYLIAAIFTLFALLGTAVAGFADCKTASMSLTAGRVEMRLSEISGDGLVPVMAVTVVNEGTINADLWLENIYPRQTDAAESELGGLSDVNAGSDAESVTIEVIYKSGTTSFVLNDLDRHGAPFLLLEGMEPGSHALVTIRQNISIQPNAIQGSLPKDSPSNDYCEQLSAPVPYMFEFILKSGTFTSLTSEAVFALTTFFEDNDQSAESGEPAAGLEQAPETQAADKTADDKTVDPSGSPDDPEPEKSEGSVAEPEKPEVLEL